MLDLRPPTAADLMALVDLNNAAAPAVNRLPAPDLARLVDVAEYKRRQTPPGVRVSRKAFGKDRRLPITSGYRG